MVEAVTVGELLKDFRSIKLPSKERAFVNHCRELFEKNGSLVSEQRLELFVLAKRYTRQFTELYAARARARRTNGLEAMGISMAEAALLVAGRKHNEELRKSDIGF